MNKLDWFPEEYQWYCFDGKGKVWSLQSNHNNQLHVLKEWISKKVFPGMEYSIALPGVVVINNKEAGQWTPWVTRFIEKGFVNGGVQLETGDVIMSFRQKPSGKDIYYRYLRKVDDF